MLGARLVIARRNVQVLWNVAASHHTFKSVDTAELSTLQQRPSSSRLARQVVKGGTEGGGHIEFGLVVECDLCHAQFALPSALAAHRTG